jgi:hypothetical protein
MSPDEASVHDIEVARSQRVSWPLGYLRKHPGWAAYFIGCIVLGAVGIFWVPFVPESLGTAQKVAGGALVGFYFSLFPIVHRLFY